ncbi:hypothetical protein ABMA67_06335 [Halobacteriovorax sp. RZ-3]|uniref:hypothetical protein n=1 Tax=Halobacteriovorax sp. RZ-3 TaxID=3157720 RepID=UPI0037203C2D
MKVLTYILITLTLLAFSMEVYGERYTAIIDENDPSVQRLIYSEEEQRASQERNQSREEEMEEKKMERIPASQDQGQNQDEYRVNEYMERHARPPLFDRKYK